MKIIIEYVGLDRNEAAEVVRLLSIAAEEAAENHPELGLPDNITIQH